MKIAILLAALVTIASSQAADAQQLPNPTGYPDGFDNRIRYITEPHLKALFRGMDAELAMRAEFRKEMAKYGTKEQYEACTANASMSPEGQKIMAAMTNVPANATAEEAQRHMAKMSAEMEALVNRACPLNPSYWNDVTKRERLEEIRSKAAEIAFPPSTTSSTNPDGSEPRGLLFLVLPEDPAPSAPDTIVSLDEAKKLSLDQYTRMIERLVAYCEYMKNRPRADPKMESRDGLRFPGNGTNVYWVFTAEEMAMLTKFDCVEFFRKYAELH